MSASGELAADVYGNTWFGTPNRGAVSYSHVTSPTLYTDTPTAQQAGLLLDLQGIPWSSTLSFAVDWGDGNGPSQNLVPYLSATDQTTDSSNYVIAGHMYARPGTYTVTATVKDIAQTITRTASVTMTGSTFVPVRPTRILDTRKGIGAPKAVVGPGNAIAVGVTNGVAVPSGIGAITAVAMNVTVTGPTGGGYITAFPDKTTLPSASNVNYAANETAPDMVVVKVGSDGKVDFHDTPGGTVQLIADMEGCYSAALGSAFVPLAPVRILDTRNGTG